MTAIEATVKFQGMKTVPAPFLLLFLACAGSVGDHAIAQPAARPAPLDRIETGLWELRAVAKTQDAPLRICVADRRQLLQPIHPAPICRQFVAAANGDQVSASYDCAARGQGHTILRIETPRLVQIDSQGVSDGQPFGVRLEGRYAGRCPAGGNP
jgi:hypothetical protein